MRGSGTPVSALGVTRETQPRHGSQARQLGKKTNRPADGMAQAENKSITSVLVSRNSAMKISIFLFHLLDHN